MPTTLNLTDIRFGSLLAKSEVFPKRTARAWNCVCDCGNTPIVPAYNLTAGRTKSCGCEAGNFTHMMSSHYLFNTWSSMINRCVNPKDPNYSNYGARGITVCSRWKDISKFIADMAPRPKHHTLDRRDNDKGYSPENCKWSTHTEQNNNTRKNVFFVEKAPQDYRRDTIYPWLQ
jgi:hypothetical protein